MERAEKKYPKEMMWFLGGIIALILLFIATMLVGMSDIGIIDLIDSVLHYDERKAHLIIRTIRLPRAVLCVLVGAAMAMAGILMQTITRNPLASPQVLGINGGASFAVVLMLVFFPKSSYIPRIIAAFIGGAIIGGMVYLLGIIKQLSPLKLTLVGLSIQMFLGALIKAVMLFNESKTSDLVFWMVGAVHQAQMQQVVLILPWIVLACMIGIGVSSSMDVLKLGDSVAISLGENINRVRLLATVSIIILAGASVAVAGPISYIGLITPHIVSKMKMNHFRTNYILCGIYGANLLLLADLISKFLKYPYESPVGIVTSFIGAVFYMFLASNQVKRGRHDG